MLILPSDDDVEETHPVDGNDSDYDPKKETKKEVMMVKVVRIMSVTGLSHQPAPK